MVIGPHQKVTEYFFLKIKIFFFQNIEEKKKFFWILKWKKSGY